VGGLANDNNNYNGMNLGLQRQTETDIERDRERHSEGNGGERQRQMQRETEGDRERQRQTEPESQSIAMQLNITAVMHTFYCPAAILLGTIHCKCHGKVFAMVDALPQGCQIICRAGNLHLLRHELTSALFSALVVLITFIYNVLV